MLVINSIIGPCCHSGRTGIIFQIACFREEFGLMKCSMKKYLTEIIGTFFFYFIIANTVIDPGAGTLAPVAIGIGLAALVYMGGHVSGAHYNPAVTLAVYLRGKCPKAEVPGYVVAQLVGAFLAALLTGYLKGGVQPPTLEMNAGPALLAEFVGTFMLVLVILNVATEKSTEGNSYFGFAIGGTVMAMAFAVGGISGGAFNPAVTTGLVVSGLLDIGDIWVHLLGQILASAAAVTAFKAMTGLSSKNV